MELLEEAEALQPNDSEVISMKANILSLCGRQEEAIALYERALIFSSDKDDIYYNIGLTLPEPGQIRGSDWQATNRQSR